MYLWHRPLIIDAEHTLVLSYLYCQLKDAHGVDDRSEARGIVDGNASCEAGVVGVVRTVDEVDDGAGIDFVVDFVLGLAGTAMPVVDESVDACVGDDAAVEVNVVRVVEMVVVIVVIAGMVVSVVVVDVHRDPSTKTDTIGL